MKKKTYTGDWICSLPRKEVHGGTTNELGKILYKSARS
jgi:hypothetical protein